MVERPKSHNDSVAVSSYARIEHYECKCKIDAIVVVPLARTIRLAGPGAGVSDLYWISDPVVLSGKQANVATVRLSEVVVENRNGVSNVSIKVRAQVESEPRINIQAMC